jgi:hypothetical protein
MQGGLSGGIVAMTVTASDYAARTNNSKQYDWPCSYVAYGRASNINKYAREMLLYHLYHIGSVEAADEFNKYLTNGLEVVYSDPIPREILGMKLYN